MFEGSPRSEPRLCVVVGGGEAPSLDPWGWGKRGQRGGDSSHGLQYGRTRVLIPGVQVCLLWSPQCIGRGVCVVGIMKT